ncbi:protein-transporting protein BCP1 [Pneumocystis jirovecii RU7]|uniref:Protein BCP1 n=1 Tax=Pneumocystis jirovecii (strain RU7) TaxID=1408657 RepID=A0A0W4ZGM1_PNEJ7|nr:protein-transporting protein BCP1 [Pneumocystis jirovecii RU7]KTW27497.1 hypothetical protein T551_02996 [Pneumocystis jirovecii RU7]
MKKRKGKHEKEASESSENDDSSSESVNEEFLNVDFEFFNVRHTDVSTLRNLLKQLIGPESESFDISGLLELILSQNLVGSVVKVDGIQSDPFAFLTVLNLNYHREKPCIKQILSYIMSMMSSNKDFCEALNGLLEKSDLHTGLILSERIVNMPTQIVPSMYELLFEEIDWALEDKEPYNFGHYIILSRSYREQVKRGFLKKKQKKDMKTVYFHPEDELFKKKSLYSMTYKYTKSDEGSNFRQAFQNPGIQLQGEIIVISKNKLKEAIADLKSILTE